MSINGELYMTMLALWGTVAGLCLMVAAIVIGVTWWRRRKERT